MRNLETVRFYRCPKLSSIAQSKELLNRTGSDATPSHVRRQLFANAAIAASRGAEPMTACISASTAHFKFAERSVGPLNLVQF